MTLDDVMDLQAAWAKRPPTHLAARRIEDILRAALGLEPPPDSGGAGAGRPVAPVTEADLMAEIAMMNAGM